MRSGWRRFEPHKHWSLHISPLVGRARRPPISPLHRRECRAGGLVWSAETLHQFLVKPKDFVKGTKMSFPGLKEQADIDNIVAYLTSFSAPAAPADGAAPAAPAAQ